MPAPVRDAVRGTPVADRKRDLIELARMPPQTQAVVAAVVAGGAETVAEARESVEQARALLQDDELAKVVAGDVAALLAAAKRVRVEQTQQARERGERPIDDDSWSTPDYIIAAARTALGGIDLDPATNAAAQTRVGATESYTAEDDGLSRPWTGRVWLNPPYSHPLVEQFTAKLLAEIDAGRVTEAIVLLNNASDTRWMQAMFRRGTLLCLVRGRIRFVNERNEPAMSPRDAQFVLYYGTRPEAFMTAFADIGTFAEVL
jgi:phage N-6-adenine-methyltransferase